ncbi:MAG: 4-hydroxy-3-methylbut-2-enyl diphosphate reductase [Lachnospiraceae bacterium]|nr:4-hydroxy-3-methylbut-2-enyl diphosphate reductase [Lachnospiraceae bacterium]
MEIKVAKTAGFCFGVERAVTKTERIAQSFCGPVYTFGPIVHNKEVMRHLAEFGVEELKDEKELDALGGGTVIIRAHGVTRALEEKLRRMRFNVVDLTCPFVKKIHEIVQEQGRQGVPVVICGDEKHPEVQGIIGWCEGPYHVISEPEDVAGLPFRPDEPFCIVSQTTFNHEKFKKIIEIADSLYYNFSKLDTVCLATQERQEEAEKLAQEVDCMLVIGSKESSNSRKLFEISQMRCNRTYFIENADEITCQMFDHVDCIGITAGASTPKTTLKEVQNHVRKF